MNVGYSQLLSQEKPIDCVSFVVQSLKLAFPMENVLNVSSKIPITPIHRTGNSYIDGVCAVRGKAVPVLDIEKFFFLRDHKEMSNADPEQSMITLTYEDMEVAFLVDVVIGSMKAGEREFLSSVSLPEDVFQRLNYFLESAFSYVDESNVRSIFFLIDVRKFFNELVKK